MKTNIYMYNFNTINKERLNMNIIITALFGLESLVKEDLLQIGYQKEDIKVSDGVVTLNVSDKGWSQDVATVNMWTRRGERVFFEVGEFKAETFDEFFEGMEKISWNDYLPKDYAIIINGYSRKSKLFGISACQSLGKKAIIKNLCRARGISEGGTINEDYKAGEIRIQFGIVDDIVRVMIDTSGDGLHKRGYRPLTHEAPIKETLAAGMISLAHYKPFAEECLVDPFCGSGTILIEAALIACNVAPGKNRKFAYENIPYIGPKAKLLAREEALELEDLEPFDDTFFWGSDLDPKAVENAMQNARNAGVDKFIHFEVSDAKDKTIESLKKQTGFDRHLIITNPPYGNRLLTQEEANKIYKMIGYNYLTKRGMCKRGARLSVITPDDSFEWANKAKADKRVKLYNGNTKCQLNNYFKLDKDA